MPALIIQVQVLETTGVADVGVYHLQSHMQMHSEVYNNVVSITLASYSGSQRRGGKGVCSVT